MSALATAAAFWLMLSIVAGLLFGAIARGRRGPRETTLEAIHREANWQEDGPCRCDACVAVEGWVMDTMRDNAARRGRYISTPPPDESTPIADAALTRERFDAIMRQEYS